MSSCSSARRRRARTRARTTSLLTELDRKQDRAPVPSDWTYAPAPEARDIVSLRDRYGHFVGGEWLEPRGTYTTISPPSEEALAQGGPASPGGGQARGAGARDPLGNGWAGPSPPGPAQCPFPDA